MRHPRSAHKPLISFACALMIGFGAAGGVGRAAECADGGDWPAWRGPDRDGISPETDWTAEWSDDGPRILWRKDLGMGCSTFAVVGDRVYTEGNSNDTETVYCLDATTGEPIWTFDFTCKLDAKNFDGGPGATPAVDGGRVYTLSRQGHIFCLDAATGKEIWRKKAQDDFGGEKPRWGFSGSPLALGDRVIYNAGATVALDKETGEAIWQTGEIGAAYSSPVVFEMNDRHLLAIFTSFGLEIYTADKGEKLAAERWKTSYEVNASTPVIDGDRIFISSGYNSGAALFRFDGAALTQLWRNTVMRSQMNTCVLWEGHLYGFDDDTLKCVTFENGEEKWAQDGLGNATLLLAGDKLIALSEQGELVVAEAAPSGFQELARAQVLAGGTCWVVPVLSDGRLFVRNNKGKAAAIDLRKTEVVMNR